MTAVAMPTFMACRSGAGVAGAALRPGAGQPSVPLLQVPGRRVVRTARRTPCCPSAAAGQTFVAGSRLAGVGSAVPSLVMTNEDLSKLVDTNDEWISTRTGIRERRVLSGDETLTQLAATAAQRALDMAGVSASELDLIVMCTSSPDDSFGGACLVQAALGASGAAAFDLTAACSGFVLGLVTGSQFIRTGGARNVLVIGADALSRFVDWRDRGTCILFGDGAGAVVLTAQPGKPCGLLGFDLNSDGSGNKHLTCAFRVPGSSPGAKPLNGGASEPGAYTNITMNGGEVFKFAVRSVPATLAASLQAAGLTSRDVDWLVMHQANQRILDSVAQRLELPSERVVSNIARYGNTSAASIPLVLDEAVRAGKIKAGHVLAMSGFGAGLSWTSAIVRWG